MNCFKWAPFSVGGLLLLLLMTTRSATAQGLQVQQPIVEQFSVDTAVSIPDRGNLLLGGISSAASATQTYGPIPYGSFRSSVLSGSQVRAHVWIHDQTQMDAAILSSVESRLGPLSAQQRQQKAREILQSPKSGPRFSTLRPLRSETSRERALSILRQRR